MKDELSPTPGSPSAIILLAEDDDNDICMMKQAFKKAGLTNAVHVVTTGAEAIEYLKGALEAKSCGGPVPLLISLDLRMPMVTGFEVLKWIRGQPALDEVPVVVMSHSHEGKDANRAIQLGARSYLVKPATFDGLVGMMRIFRTLVEQVENRPAAAAGARDGLAPSRIGGAMTLPSHGAGYAEGSAAQCVAERVDETCQNPTNSRIGGALAGRDGGRAPRTLTSKSKSVHCTSRTRAPGRS